MLGTVLSSIVLGTFIMDNPISSWKFEQKLQVKIVTERCDCMVNCIVSLVLVTMPSSMYSIGVHVHYIIIHVAKGVVV